ncbi:MAG TPA: hypothetical protein VGC55_10990 [Dokdonella sp.]
MSIDAFECFEEASAFNRATGEAYRRSIRAAGARRERESKPDALRRRRGFAFWSAGAPVNASSVS